MIKVENVSKSFKNNLVLKNVNMDILPGKITSLVGLNGAGKSTLISLIMKFKEKDSGEVKRTTVSVMPDAETMIEDMTGEQFLKFISKLKKISKEQINLIYDLADSLFIKNDLKKKIKSYSFGMKKKISFIQAYIGEFDSYIFDEPTSGVDIESARIMMNHLINLKKRGKAILLTSHNIDEVQEFSDYIFLLKHGEIVRKGTIEEIINKEEKPIYSLKLNISNFTESIEKYCSGVEYIVDDNEVEIYSNDLLKLNKLMIEMIKAGGLVISFGKEQRKLKDVIFVNE
ncbi:ABC transporter ATP-binding protein [Lactococcus lactis]|uniref:ABC transporter ATP-binding protein n=1 Tax=Lactococcus lactis TaxID=1358 RepID=UPI0020748C8E|nr:ABC transporter ATP-binding protein [Lactococcus lactis]MCM6849559.1 ABC transporter ATP-binding protein [Lactococcus lactis]MCM6851687.1 ABC transporter ATP-binding protein [Lactococcus lactis]MCM6859421.1 ABC transporter ATP-binding protein [Lactococcus lactis]